jgi:hypothetical protein
MATGFIMGADATAQNINSLPKGLLPVGYSTGTPDVMWTTQDFDNHPGALRICQDNGSDETADYIDVESGAATYQDAAVWYPKALQSYETGQRPGQRWPGMYVSMSNVTALANELVAAKITAGPKLIIAKWGTAATSADAVIAAASGPYPIVGMQIADVGVYDLDVYSESWVNEVSKTPLPAAPPGQWSDDNWDWKDAVITGIGLDGELISFAFNPATGSWTRL